ncbi:unnamed protein product [Rotaria sp. Silwood1]|nr:unnamed protein product [Rotaria sp. Silwood1]CAF1509080.1 unnamed protein product [Rotaria sp. Silwood1]CAF1510288.1 unnamed protein product [Rotaria sp. Silwood1]CAF3553128.1 unnamed protein product [Rotaria sp. Silwood1]CAF3641004.1 unnamed protein product [Rotaria sp. Silwood1]
MYENSDIPTISSSSRIIYPYETIVLSSPIRSLYENNNNTQQSAFISYESNLSSSSSTKEISITRSFTPPFQKKLPIIFVIILGLFEIFGGLIVLIFEILIFDIAIGLWCGFIYALAGVAAIVLVISTDRERHHTSTVLIIQFVAFMFTITEILLHINFYLKRCVTKFNEPSRETSYQCLILLIQIGGAAIVLISTIIFAIIYIRITIMVLKQPHGTFNITNAMNITC